MTFMIRAVLISHDRLLAGLHGEIPFNPWIEDRAAIDVSAHPRAPSARAAVRDESRAPLRHLLALCTMHFAGVMILVLKAV